MLTAAAAASAIIATVTLCGVLYMFAVRTAPKLQPATVYPFAPGSSDPSADTLCGQAAPTVLVDDGWTVATLNRLCDVEDLLDSLEAHGITEREMETVGNAQFLVRWK
jgi:hypothetical protein